MTVSPKVFSKRKSGLFILAILLLLLGGTALYIGSNNFLIRSLGILACTISVYCVRKSNIHASSQKIIRPTPVGRSTWTISIILLPALGLSFLFLYRDAIHGYHQGWPVILFAGVVAGCALCWSYLVSRLQ